MTDFPARVPLGRSGLQLLDAGLRLLGDRPRCLGSLSCPATGLAQRRPQRIVGLDRLFQVVRN